MTQPARRLGLDRRVLPAALVGGLAARVVVGAPPILMTLVLGLFAGLALAVTPVTLADPDPDRDLDRATVDGPAPMGAEAIATGRINAVRLGRPATPDRVASTGEVLTEWWRAPDRAAPANGHSRARRPLIPLASYLPNTPEGRFPQCPACSGFAVAAPAQGYGVFGCAACGHRWRWTPGQPWPALAVQPFPQPSRND